MKQPHTANAAVISMFIGLAAIDSATVVNPVKQTPTIQVAILLDVSNSMDGLIEQAKGQLWNMVKVLGKVKCNEASVPIEIALYEYGRPSNDPKEGYVKQITGFTNDLDKLFTALTLLTTNGGDEYCGHVLYKSLEQLQWDTTSGSYKVIFIAGNESFLQGDVQYTQACEKAKVKGIIINTIYCGSREMGIREHWDLGGECGNGNFTNINKDAIEEVINTPYDSALFLLNNKLKGTYIAYGDRGLYYQHLREESDTLPVYNLVDATKITNYIIVKSNPAFSPNTEWDLINAKEKDSTVIETLDMTKLTDSLKTKTRQQLKLIVEAKATERKSIQHQIASLGEQRDAYVITEKKKKNTNSEPTLESEVERIIKEQIKQFKMTIQ